jgi:hypothetical protein
VAFDLIEQYYLVFDLENKMCFDVAAAERNWLITVDYLVAVQRERADDKFTGSKLSVT